MDEDEGDDLDVLVDVVGGAEEGVLDVVAGLGGALEEDEAVLLGELGGLLVGDGPLALQVRLVPDQEDDGVGVGEVAGVGEPGAEVVVGGAA